MKITPLSLFKVYEDKIDFSHLPSTKLPAYIITYNQKGDIEELPLKCGGCYFTIFCYCKFSDQSDEDALRLLYRAGLVQEKRVDLSKHKTIFKYRSRQIFVNPEGLYARPFVNGLGGLVVARDGDIVTL